MAKYAARWDEARRSGAKIFFADEAHFRADAELGARSSSLTRPTSGRTPSWGQVGAQARASLGGLDQPALWEKASYYSAVCLETGEVERMELEGNSNSGTLATFLDRLRGKHSGPLDVIWDNAPAHRGEAVREYLRTPGLELRLVNPRFHEGRLCRVTARTSPLMRRSGAGRGRKPPETCAWEPRPWYRRESATSSTGCPAVRRRSSAVAAPSCNQGPKGYCRTPSPIPNPRLMHIPPWL